MLQADVALLFPVISARQPLLHRVQRLAPGLKLLVSALGPGIVNRATGLEHPLERYREFGADVGKLLGAVLPLEAFIEWESWRVKSLKVAVRDGTSV